MRQERTGYKGTCTTYKMLKNQGLAKENMGFRCLFKDVTSLASGASSRVRATKTQAPCLAFSLDFGTEVKSLS